jgi:hypothetical protein
MRRSVFTAAILVTAGLVALPGCGSGKSGSGAVSTPSSSPSSSPQPVSPETLATALLAPADLASLGSLVVTNQQNGTGVGVTGSGLAHGITFVSGDPGCRSVLSPHTPTAKAWAFVYMGDTKRQTRSVVVDEDIESFAQPAEAQQVMKENHAQLANCHTFVGDNSSDKARLTFTHQAVSVPTMGEDAVAHQLDGVAGEKFLTWNMVEVRSGTDVVFIDYSPAQHGTANTAVIAAAAMTKYSKVRG